MRHCSRLFSLIIIIILHQEVYPQTQRGDKELSIVASFISIKYEKADEAWTAVNIPIRFGFFVTKNIEIEPELLFSKYEDEDAGFILSGNLAYNFTPSSEGIVVPFVFAGLGFSNTTILLPNIAFEGRENKNWTVFNLGGGLKTFLAKSFALRLEYRFQNLFGDTDISYHNILLGISAFLK